MQIAAGSRSYIFDMYGCETSARDAIISAISQVLQSSSIEKVLHDGRADSAALKYQLGVTLSAPIFDTQVRPLKMQRQIRSSDDADHCQLCVCCAPEDVALLQ